MTRDPQAQRLTDYLGHILDAIERIQAYTRGMDESAFARSLLVQDAVIRNLEVIGEASRNIERTFPEFSQAHPDLPLALAYDMRNVLAHGYFKIDLGIVWATLTRDLSSLHARMASLRASLDGQAEL